MIVLVASVARSGNTWFRILLSRLYGMKSYSWYGDPLFEEMGASELIGHAELPVKRPKICDLIRDDGIYFLKTHELYDDLKSCLQTVPIIYMVRDGRDVIVSQAHFWAETQEKSVKGLMSDLVRTDRWSEHVLEYISISTAVVKFESLITNPIRTCEEALFSIGLRMPMNDANLPTFKELHKKWPNFFRRGEVGAWRSEMEEPLQELYWKRHHKALGLLGYGRH